MVRVGIIGASGYTAYEAIRLLMRHPHVQLTAATSRQGSGQSIEVMHPQLTGRVNLAVEDLNPQQVAMKCDVALTCLPHGTSAEYIIGLMSAGCKVIDLSADYRLGHPALYKKWYGADHPDAARLGQTPYGLPELFGDAIPKAPLIANPGCYPTSVILPLAPLLEQNLIDPNTIIADSKSGVSGAGRTPKMNNLFPECNESFSAYGVGNHRHQPEIVDILQRFTGIQPEVAFTPHLVPMDRGILSTIYVKPAQGVTTHRVFELLHGFYDKHPFVRVVTHLPATKFVAHTNYCDIAVRENGSWIILLSALDNLIKGASGAAVQNLNIMNGWDQTLGLL